MSSITRHQYEELLRKFSEQYILLFELHHRIRELEQEVASTAEARHPSDVLEARITQHRRDVRQTHTMLSETIRTYPRERWWRTWEELQADLTAATPSTASDGAGSLEAEAMP
jgi:C4-dicarboxylate-specific signal transduction histidine kinase